MKKPAASLLTSLFLLITACGDSKTPSGSPGGAEVHLSGVVLNDDEPVTRAKIEATDQQGRTIATAAVEADAHYRLMLPAGTAFPVTLTAIPEGLDKRLKAVVTSDLVSEQDISSVTTIVVDTAINLGGLTEANLAKAAGAAISQRKSSGGSGGSAGFKGDPTKQYGGWH